MRIVETQEFNDLINLMELVDVPTIGTKFTWTNLEGSLRSRLGRFILAEGLIDD